MQTNWAHFLAGKAGVVPLSLGMPGTAKTAVHRALAQQARRRFIPLMLDQLLPEDLSGLPVPRTININGADHDCVVRLASLPGLANRLAFPSLPVSPATRHYRAFQVGSKASSWREPDPLA